MLTKVLFPCVNTHVFYTKDPQPLVCTVSLPLTGIFDSVVHSVECLEYLLRLLNPFPSWNIVYSPLLLCKVQVHIFRTHNVTVSFSVSVTSAFC